MNPDFRSGQIRDDGEGKVDFGRNFSDQLYIMSDLFLVGVGKVDS